MESMDHHTRDGYNHPHWDHSALPQAKPARWNSPRLRHALRRAHLPVHPLAPLVLIVLGIAWCLSVADLLVGSTGSRPLFLAIVAIVGPMLMLGLGLVLTGAWDLVRGPLQRLLRHARH